MPRHLRPLAALSATLLLITACGGTEAEDAADAPELAEGGAAPQTEAPVDPQAAEGAPGSVEAPEGSLAASEMVLGSPDAPLTVVEYASVTCPACAAFHEQTFPIIKEELIDTGMVRFVFREFPTAPVQLSYAGSILARCAATDTGAEAFFPLIKTLFQRQGDWVYGQDPGAALTDIFSQVGFDRTAIENCLRRQDIIDAINENVKAGQDAEIRGTPTLLIDGKPFDIRRAPEAVVEDLRARAEAAAG